MRDGTKLVIMPRRRKRKRYIIDKKRLVLCVVLLILGVELVMVAFTSPFFAVKEVRVAGNETISPAEILERVQLPENPNIFLLRKRDVVRRLAENPVVKGVWVYRHPPAALIVRIEEREPYLLLNAAGTLYHADSSGVPFRIVEKADGKLPVISCKLTDQVRLGKSLESPSFVSALACLLLAQEKKNFRVAKITVDLNGDMCLNDRDEFQVKLGRPEQLSKKLDIAAQAMEQIPEFGRRGKYIDVTSPDFPALKLRE